MLLLNVNQHCIIQNNSLNSVSVQCVFTVTVETDPVLPGQDL